MQAEGICESILTRDLLALMQANCRPTILSCHCLLQVFKATDTQTGGAVAIKQVSLSGITSENLQAVVGEIDLLKNLRHKNIVEYIGSFKTRTHLSIILEYMEKGSLADVIRPAKFGAFPESLAAVYIAQVNQYAMCAPNRSAAGP